MAFVNEHEVAGSTAEGTGLRRAGEAEPAPNLTTLEWSVVAIAQHDRLSSLKAPGRISAVLAALFGKSPSPRLADPRLEALRRMAVLSWHHGYAVPMSEIRTFLAAGFTEDHYEKVLDSISRSRPARQRKF